MTSRSESNRDRALHAALAIAGGQGIRALTHGRVDSTAGLPSGTTSNHFRTRAALLHATVDHLVGAEQRHFAAESAPQTVDDLVAALAQFIRDAAGAQRDLTAARYAFFAEGFHDPHIREVLAQARHRVDVWAAQSLEVLGVSRPFAAARRMLTYVDGAILHALAFDAVFRDEDIAVAVHSLIDDVDGGA
ncbi:TetR/AcrR family transcriptional regulator [Paramicrobacterium agarici]|uniref:TetR family transcriptional regulator n=1 Tax=Paramicrobacterium agarici TaxID=630514 RepID=A0A2A9DTH9_9MICO|nr:ABC-F family ATP-binding cassette domain-containing protein [Microbacterium agarici]PFG29282.1 TetR family transcriptional regulator [Microbacterium agarici]TQO22231.1 TetR family transcriptional regulator [Microbacterium agarici]